MEGVMAAIGVHLGATCACAAVYKVRGAAARGPAGMGLGWRRRLCPFPAPRSAGCPEAADGPGGVSPQDGRADVVANDAGDRVTPAVVAFSESEEVRLPL